MQLIHEQDHIRIRFHFCDQPLHPLFKFPAVFGACDQPCQIQCINAFAPHAFRNRSDRNTLCESLQNSCLSDSRFADKTWIVLRPAAQNLHQTEDLFFSPDDRIQLSVLGSRRQIMAELL